MRVIRFRITTRKFERRSGKLLSENVRQCASAAGAAAYLWQAAENLSHSLPNAFLLTKTILEIGNDRGWIEYDPTINQTTVHKLKEDLIHAGDLHSAFYDDGEGSKGVAP